VLFVFGFLCGFAVATALIVGALYLVAGEPERPMSNKRDEKTKKFYREMYERLRAASLVS
jgi:hypothetical protein